MTNFTNFKSLKRPPKPNTCLVAPENHCLADEPDFAAPMFDIAGADLFAKLRDIVAQERKWTRMEGDPDALKLKFVAVTGLMRFKDDVDVGVIPTDDGKSTLAIYSRSRVGYSDLGANRKRVTELIRRMSTN